MPRPLLWVIAGVAAALALVVVLWRRRKDESGKPTTTDYLVALGIFLALFGTALSLLAAQRDAEADAEPEDVIDYRNDVWVACAALEVNNQSVSLDALVDGNGDIVRSQLIDAFTPQLDAAAAILDDLWATPVPPQLSSDAEDARQAGDMLLERERAALDAMGTELPASVPYQQAVLYLQRIAAENLPTATAFQGAMSELAGEDCRQPA